MGEILPKALLLPALFLAFLTASTGALAQSETPASPPEIPPEACVGIESAAERLACYDLAVGRDALPGSEGAPTSPPAELGATPFGGGPPELLEGPSPTDGDPDEPPVTSSLLDSRWELSRNAKLGTWSLRGYKPIYVLPFFWNDSPNASPSSPAPDHTVTAPDLLDDAELKYQLSFKTKIWQGVFGHRGDLWFGYTQSSRWQVFNADTSRPFRETNYEPEALLIFHTRYDLLGLNGRLVGVSLNHQSNGRDNPYSRGWNRLIGMIGLERDSWTVMLRPWLRIGDHSWDDDNPDIEDFVGRGDVQVVRRIRGHELALMLRHSFAGGDRSHGAAALEWAFPIRGELKGRLEIFHGYGESLIDYNDRSTLIGLGVSLIEWY